MSFSLCFFNRTTTTSCLQKNSKKARNMIRRLFRRSRSTPLSLCPCSFFFLVITSTNGTMMTHKHTPLRLFSPHISLSSHPGPLLLSWCSLLFLNHMTPSTPLVLTHVNLSPNLFTSFVCNVKVLYNIVYTCAVNECCI